METNVNPKIEVLLRNIDNHVVHSISFSMYNYRGNLPTTVRAPHKLVDGSHENIILGALEHVRVQSPVFNQF